MELLPNASRAESTAKVDTLDVIMDGGWKIKFRDCRFGPYATKREAIATAEMWAYNGRKQGHRVVVVIAGDVPVAAAA